MSPCQRPLLMTHSYGRREAMRGAGLVTMAAGLRRGPVRASPCARTDRPRSEPPGHGVKAAPLPGPRKDSPRRPAQNERC